MRSAAGILLLSGLVLLQGCSPDNSATGNTTPATTTENARVQRTPAPAGASVFFITPVDGQTVQNPVVVKFGISGMSVAPAGDARPASGHHHLLIDTQLTDAELNQPIAKDAQHLHFGKGQTETTLELSPGQHTLQLVLGDASHIPHEPPVMSTRITINVE
ncbi:MAG TPA: DUF4399 domain-containing protein [Chromatiales bacterium]|nr:DUF4399 domain-containing protein [Chromatiales bacterium]